MKLRLPNGLRAALIACLAGMTGAAYADYTWADPATEITTEAWAVSTNWTGSSTFPTAGSGPATANSNAWDKIIINGASGTVADLEGWNFRLNLGVLADGSVGTASTLTISNIRKLQGGLTTINIGKGSTLTMTKGASSAGNDGGAVPINFVGGGTMNFILANNKGGDATTVSYGTISDSDLTTVGSFNLSSNTKGTARTFNNLVIAATIADSVDSTETATLHSITLGTVSSDVTITSLSSSITAENYTEASGVLEASEDTIGSYSVVNDNGTLKLMYVTGASITLVWNGTDNDSDWNSTAENWLNGTTARTWTRSATADFTSAAESKVVNLSGDVSARIVNIKDDYTFNTTADTTITANALNIDSGKTLTKSGSATLTVGAVTGSVAVTEGTLAAGAITGSAAVSGGSLTGSTISGDVIVTGGEVSLSGAAKMINGSLSITDGTVTLTHTSNNGTSAIASGATVKINAGGTLNLTGHDMLGWGGNSPTNAIELLGTSEKKATLNLNDTGAMTLKTGLKMGGYSEVSGTAFNSYGTSISASGTSNEISATIQVRNALTITVEDGGDLTISGNLTNGQSQDSSDNLTKAGNGTLTIAGTNNSFSHTFIVNGGTLEVADGASLGSASVQLASGTSLTASGDLTLTGTVTLNGATITLGTEQEHNNDLTLSDLTVNNASTINANLVMGNGDSTDTITFAQGASVTLGCTLDLGENTKIVLSAEDIATLDANGNIDLFTSVEGLGTYLADGGTVWIYSADDTTLATSHALAFKDDGKGGYTAYATPEPATATLSLLALAGLCARRRRRA